MRPRLGLLPTVLVDMDGPLADFDRAFRAMCVQRGWTLDCEAEDQTAYYATAHIPDLDERAAARRHVDSEPSWFRDLPVVDGAVAGLHALATVAEVWICTKPLEANPRCRDAKAAWLAEHFGPDWVRRLIIAPDKGMVRGDILLDDAPRREWLARAEWRPVIYDRPYNRTGWTAGLPRWTWTDGTQALLDPLGWG